MMLLSRLSFKAFNLWSSKWTYIISKFIIPSINIIIYYNIARITNNISQSFVLNSVLIVMISTIINDSIIFIQAEKRFHTLTPILITPINKFKLYVSRITINYFLGIVITMLYFIVAAMIFSVTISSLDYLYVILHMVSLSLPLLIFSIFIGFVSILVEEVTIITMVFYYTIIITSGIFGKVNFLYLSWLTPIKFYIQNINNILLGQGIKFSDFLPYVYYIIIYLITIFIFIKPIEKQIYIHGAKEE